jgi:hypothetical protein
VLGEVLLIQEHVELRREILFDAIAKARRRKTPPVPQQNENFKRDKPRFKNTSLHLCGGNCFNKKLLQLPHRNSSDTKSFINLVSDVDDHQHISVVHP